VEEKQILKTQRYLWEGSRAVPSGELKKNSLGPRANSYFHSKIKVVQRVSYLSKKGGRARVGKQKAVHAPMPSLFGRNFL